MDALLDIERRTGVSNAELEEFERKTSEVADLIKGLKEGRIKPSDIKVPGEKTPEEVRAEEEKKERERLETLRKAKEAKEKEIKTWWERAQVVYGVSRQDARKERIKRIAALRAGHKSTSRVAGQEEENLVITDDDGNVLFPKPKAKADALDYTVWDRWTPDDPVSLQDMQRAKDKIEEERNALFEENNPEFCAQFKQDQAKRVESQEKKAKEADKLKVQGNKLFKKKQLDQALKTYFKSLEVVPWTIPVLCNIAQVYLRQGQVEDALEISERALFLDPENIKALWRHATASIQADALDDAVDDLTYAALLDPENKDVQSELEKTRQELFERRAEAALRQKQQEQQQQQQQSTENTSNNSKKTSSKKQPKNKNSKKTIAAIQKDLHAVLKDPTSDLSLAQRMCNQVSGIRVETPMTVPQTLAIDGLSTLIRECAGEQEKAQLLVLMRTSGAFEKLCEVILSPSSCSGGQDIKLITELVMMSVCGSTRNQDIFSSKGILDRALECCSEPHWFAILCAMAEEPRCRSSVTTPACVRAAASMLGSSNDDKAKSDAALFIANIAATGESRGCLEAALLEDSATSSTLLKNVEGAVIAGGSAQENASAAIANLCQIPHLRALVDSRVLLRACFAKQSSQLATSSVLAALVNLTVDANSSARAVIVDDAMNLCKLFKLAMDPAGQPAATQDRAAALVSRLCADAQHQSQAVATLQSAHSGEQLVVLLGKALKAANQSGAARKALVEHLVRTLAAVFRVHCVYHAETLVVLNAMLANCARGAKQGVKEIIRGSDQTTTNLVQCFVSLTSNASFCENAQTRTVVIPALIDLLQFAQDGPIRKNSAICVAKLARSGPANMQEIRALRGMQMLVELGGRLA